MAAAGDRWRDRAIPGLHGRKPVFATPRALASSYMDPYIDLTGRVTGYAVVDLRVMGSYDWRLADTNVWKVERMLLEHPHRSIRVVEPARERAARAVPGVQTAVPRQEAALLSQDTGSRWTELPEGIGNSPSAMRQSRSKSRDGLVIGSSRAWRSASSNRFDNASPRDFSESTDCWKTASRRAASSARMRCASLNSGLLPRSGSLCATTRPRLVSMTSAAWQHGHVTSISDFSRAAMMMSFASRLIIA